MVPGAGIAPRVESSLSFLLQHELEYDTGGELSESADFLSVKVEGGRAAMAGSKR